MRTRLVKVLAVTLLLAAGVAHGASSHRTQPRLIDQERFVQLLAAIDDEKFADGKLTQLRITQGLYLFSGAQAVAVLGSFEFWNDRLEGLRLILPADSACVGAILRYFEAAPDSYRSEARRILRL